MTWIYLVRVIKTYNREIFFNFCIESCKIIFLGLPS